MEYEQYRDEVARIRAEIETLTRRIAAREAENKKIEDGILSDEEILKIIKDRRLEDNYNIDGLDEYMDGVRSDFLKYPRGHPEDSRSHEAFWGLDPPKQKIIDLQQQLLLTETVGLHKPVFTAMMGVLRNVETVGIPGILNLLMADKAFSLEEQANKEGFWEAIFAKVFPEYVALVVVVVGTDRRVFSWKKLCLWMNWAHSLVIRKLEHAPGIYSNKQGLPIGEVDIARLNWHGEIITRQKFALENGFFEGRLLAFYANHYSKEMKGTPKEKQRAATLDNKRNGVLFPFAWRAHFDDSVEFKVNTENTELGEHMMHQLILWASSNAPFSEDYETGESEMRMIMRTGGLDRFPRHKGTGLINVGCQTCSAADSPAIFKCSRCSSSFCSHKCGAQHIGERTCRRRGGGGGGNF